MKRRKILIVITMAVAVATMYGCSQQAEASDGRNEVDRHTRAEKISRFGHSYVYLECNFNHGNTFLHDPDCHCRKGGAQ